MTLATLSLLTLNCVLEGQLATSLGEQMLESSHGPTTFPTPRPTTFFDPLCSPKLRSTSGVTIFVFNCLVCWSSKRQTLTARSTFEAELIAASVAADEAAWFHSLQSELNFIFAPDGSDIMHIPLLIDNLNALNIANHPKQTPVSKHVKLREFRIQDHAKANTVRNLWVPTPLNVSDFFTKPMGSIMSSYLMTVSSL